MSGSVRMGGALLTLSMVLLILMIAAWPILIDSTNLSAGTDTNIVMDRAAHLMERQTEFRAVWITESIATMALAVGGLVLSRRPATPASLSLAGWTSVAVGATIYLVIYA